MGKKEEGKGQSFLSIGALSWDTKREAWNWILD
jgi:hypothetical protein